jgi:carboxypeptidase C (cathepsin A)
MQSILTVLVVILILRPIEGQALSFDSAASDIQSDVVVSRRTIKVRGTALSYIARAGFILLRDETRGEVSAKVFFASYTVEPRRGEPLRPLTFYANGGPGEPATLSYVGPRYLNGGRAEGQLPSPPYEMVDNPDTWLTMTDLVLIDPVGTGYSRASNPEYTSAFYNPDGDAESVAQFMQLYLQRYDPNKRQPIFVAGPSYATLRFALVADIAPRRGIPLSGLILASSALGNEPQPPPFSDLPDTNLAYALDLPTLTATAFFHKKLSHDLQRNFDDALAQAESWAADEYPKLLEHRNDLSGDQLRAGAAEMARLTGLAPEVVLYNRFRVLPDAFLREQLGAEWTPLGLYDSRKLKADQAADRQNPKWTTVLSDLYLSGELQVRSDMPYSYDPILSLKWSCGITCTANPQAFVRLRHAMRENPSLQVMITNGYYDFATPYFGTKRAISQLEPELRSRVSVTYYKAGHKTPPEHREEVARFIQKVSATRRKMGTAHIQSTRWPTITRVGLGSDLDR